MMAGAGRELAVTHGAQVLAHRLFGDPYPELLPDPLAEIDQTPAHHPWMAGVGPASINSASALRCSAVSRGAGPGDLRSIRPGGAIGIELHHPVGDDLRGRATDPS
jgi:hypothetical protein